MYVQFTSCVYWVAPRGPEQNPSKIHSFTWIRFTPIKIIISRFLGWKLRKTRNMSLNKIYEICGQKYGAGFLEGPFHAWEGHLFILLSFALQLFYSSNIFEYLKRGLPLSTYAKFSEKLTFLTSWYAHRGLEMLVFRKILRTYLIDNPKGDLHFFW